MFERIYVEIGNICNLSCSFCAGTKREKKQMTRDEFSLVIKKIKDKTKYIYLHVLGEPLFHPELEEFLALAREEKIPLCITTNGVLLDEKRDILIKNNSILHKVSISLHSLEGNDISLNKKYLENAVSFAKEAADKGIYVVFRLWNEDSREGKGKNHENEAIEDFLKEKFTEDWQSRPKGVRLCKNIFLEYDGVFTWPNESKAKDEEKGFCHGLSTQLGILVDGSVVPCCLDSEGIINLGNIFDNSLEEILDDEMAKSIKEGFKKGKIIHPLCKKCTFVRKFKIRNN